MAEINAVLCKGCGVCVAACRGGAITLHGFTDQQLLAQLAADAGDGGGVSKDRLSLRPSV